MGKNITIYDIAQEAGVSTATVSRVMSGTRPVSPKLAQRVLDVMQRYHYQPSALARGLYKQESRTICFLMPEMGNPYYSTLFSGAMREAESNGYMLQSLYQPYERALSESMTQQLIQHRLDGVILNCEALLRIDHEGQMALIRQLREYMRVVMLGGMPQVEDVPIVTIDLAECLREAVAYLHDELGHTRIYLLGGHDAVDNPYARTAGYHEAMLKRGLEPVFVRCDCTAQDAYQRMFQMETLPTAVICANDLVAAGVLRMARERGVEVPRDLSVVGCDNTLLCELVAPELTSFDLCTQQTGQFAVRMALGLEKENSVVLHSRLVKRKSCAPVRG